jgi:hypothetical protein
MLMPEVPQKEFSTPMLHAARAAVGEAPFRGGAVENLGDAPMGKGHGNAGLPFDLDTACYLKPIFAEYDAARKNGRRLFLVLKAGVKTVKSFTGEVCAADHVCHANGDFAIFFATGDTADVGATTRILDFYRGIPSFARKLTSIQSRFDETKGALKFPDKTLFLLAANMSNTQQKNLGGLLFQDALLAEATGMIAEMVARTTQYQKEAVIFLESQGGEKGYDFDESYEKTDQRELHVSCPCCGMSHVWNWKAFDEQSMTRSDTFIATLPIADCRLPIEEQEVKRAELTARLKNNVAGFKRGADELIKFENGDYNEAAILRETHFECFHCGGIWRDDGEFGATRIALDQSSHYVAARTNALPGNVGFNVPQWINRRLGWGRMMLDKLIAQKTNKKFGNVEDLKKWWQKVAARTWDDEIFAPRNVAAPLNIFNDEQPLTGEKVRIATVDVQDNLTNVWIQLWAIGEGSMMRMLHWEHVMSPMGITLTERREFCKNRCRELFKLYKIQPQNVKIDIGHMPELIFQWAAQDVVANAKLKHLDGRVSQEPVFYGLVRGDSARGYKHRVRGNKVVWAGFSPKFYEQIIIEQGGSRTALKAPYRLMSTERTQRVAQRFIDQNEAPKMEIPPKYLEDKSNLGLWQQLNSEHEVNVRGKMVWQQISQRPNHARDCFRMALMRMEEGGLLVFAGKVEAGAENGEE